VALAGHLAGATLSSPAPAAQVTHRQALDGTGRIVTAAYFFLHFPFLRTWPFLHFLAGFLCVGAGRELAAVTT
jgi:hypothetical protein